MIYTKEIQSQRLILRKALIKDAESLYNNWDSDIEMHKYVGYELHTSIENTKKLINKWISEYENRRLTWVIEIKENNEVIGVISASSNELDNKITEVGFSIGTKYQGNGYATEALKVIIRYLILECKLDIVKGGCYSTNVKSARTMLKAGMKEVVNTDKEIRYFEIRKEDLIRKYVRVMDGIKSNAGGFEYKLDEINYSDNWNPNETEPDKMGGFNFGSEDKILRWLHRGDTMYDVIIPEDTEVVLCNEEKGVWRANKIIVTNPRQITYELVIELYKKTTLSNKVLAQCLQTLLWKNRLEISKYIIRDRVNKENVDEFIKEFEDYNKKTEIFNYDELGQDSKTIYDMLIESCI